MPSNQAAALSYLLGFVTGMIFLVASPFKRDTFVRFHAFQSIFFSTSMLAFELAFYVAGLILTCFSLTRLASIFWYQSLVIASGSCFLWLFLMQKAWCNQRYLLPYIGDLAAKHAGEYATACRRQLADASRHRAPKPTSQVVR